MLALGFARLADSFGNALLIVVLPLYVTSQQVTGSRFGLSTVVVTGIVLAAFGVFDSVVQPFVGRVSDRLGRRRAFVLFGLVVLAVTNAAFSLTATYVDLFVVRIVQGVGVGVTVTASVALLSEYSTTENRGVNFGIFNALRLVGFGVGPVVAGILVSDGPYRVLNTTLSGFAASFDVAALAAVVGLVVVATLVRDPETTTAAAASDLTVEITDGAGGLDPVFSLAVGTLFVAAGIALFATIEPAINARLGQSARTFGFQFAAFVAAFILTQPIVGTLSDRFGRKPFIVAGLALTAPVLFAQGFVTASWEMTLLRAIQGVGSAMAFGPALALAGDLAAGGATGSKLSLLTMAFGLGAGVGPIAAGPLIEVDFAAPFVVAGLLVAASAWVVHTQVADTVLAADESDREVMDTVATED